MSRQSTAPGEEPQRLAIEVRESPEGFYVITNIPDSGGYAKGPMSEGEAMALAKELTEGLKRSKKRPSRMTLALVVLAWAVVFLGIFFAVWEGP